LKRPDPRNGIVLVTVLWTIALLSALAMATSTTFRGFAGIITIDRDRAQAEALLTAGLEVSAGMIGKLGNRPLTERETVITLSTGSVHMRLTDEGGRIDVNKAPVEVLSGLLRAIGASDDAGIIAQSIDAWRVRDGGDRPGAAIKQPDEPQRKGAGTRQGEPADAKANEKANSVQSFTDLRQLAQVPGMTPEYLAAITPLTTVFGDDKVNVLTAPVDVMRALPGIGPAQLDALLEARRRLPIAEGRLEQILGPAQNYLKLQARPVASVELTARLIDGYTAAARAVIVLVPDDKQPYRVLAWTPLPSSGRGAFVANRF
jgi:type II secretory pathway component PulK